MGVKFPKSAAASLTEVFKGSERQIQELKWKKEKTMEDIKREQALLGNVKLKFEKKKEEFLKFLTASSSYASQVNRISKSSQDFFVLFLVLSPDWIWSRF